MPMAMNASLKPMYRLRLKMNPRMRRKLLENRKRIALILLGLGLLLLVLRTLLSSPKLNKRKELAKELMEWLPDVPFHFLLEHGGNR